MLTQEQKLRLKPLRDAAVRPTISYTRFYLAYFTRFRDNASLGSMEKRYSDAYRLGFDAMTPQIDDGELIVGKATIPLTPEENRAWRELIPFCRETAPDMGQHSHMAIDYDLVLQKGVSGILATVEEKLAVETDGQKREFYESCRESLHCVIRFAQRYSDHASELAARETRPQRKAELEEIARICAKVPRYPAESFHEAVQSAHFITFCLCFKPMCWFGVQLYQMGRPDRYLWPYYEKDVATGKLTRQDAQLLLDCLGIQINNQVPRGLSSGYMVGGRDGEGKLVANELTELCMNVVEDNRLVYPSVGLCYTSDMPERFLQRACEILAQGCSHPAIFNDDVIAEGLQLYGVPEKDSHRYIHSTCVEITPEAASNVWVASPYINLMAPLMDCLTEQHDTMDSLVASVFARLDKTIADELAVQNRWRLRRAEFARFPLLSCVVDDCLESGVDIEQGGARYNWIMPSFVGMANLADSLSVIDAKVFREKKYTLAQIKTMTDCNFDGCEAQRLELLNKVDKYGNDVEEADKWCDLLTRHIVAACAIHTPVLPNARLVPSVFCWEMHAELGLTTGATPDGRKAGFPLGDGSGPAQGRERKGPTASIISSTKWSHKEFIGGVAVNLKFAKSVFTADSCQRMLALVKTYLQRGGFELQINVVDRDTLLEAQKNPEDYQDLVVRIGGYSDYFVKLSPQMQAEVLLRTEHNL